MWISTCMSRTVASIWETKRNIYVVTWVDRFLGGGGH